MKNKPNLCCFKVDFDDSTSQNRFVVKPGVDENLDESMCLSLQEYLK
jgi:hypothetical protein